MYSRKPEEVDVDERPKRASSPTAQATDGELARARDVLTPFAQETVDTGGVTYGGMRNAIAAEFAKDRARIESLTEQLRQEREACAKIADEAGQDQFDDPAMRQFAFDIAEIIRNREQP